MAETLDIVCLSSIDWDLVQWQGHQEIMSTLAAQGHRVLFVENTGVRSAQLRDVGRLRSRLRNWRRGVNGFRRERENLFVFSPLVLPFPYSRVARAVNRWLLSRALRRWLRAIGSARPLVWTFLPTPLVHELLDALDPSLVVYYCIDDFASSSAAARRVVASEDALFRRADLVFTTSEELRARAARFNDRVHVFPFGVNIALFEEARSAGAPAPADLAALPRPVAGYVGGLHQWLDQPLLAEVARRLPSVSFALIGPPYGDVSALAACPNVYLLGARSHDRLPAYIGAFDVGLVPYRLTDYTANVYPTKLNEYLAMGIPVVATNLPEIRRFNREHGELVAIGADAETFAAAVGASVGARTPAMVDRRVGVARQNSWQQRIARMTELIDKALTARGAAQGQWEVRLRRLYRTTRRRLAGAVVGVLGAYLLLFQTPLVWGLATPLRLSAPPQRVDAVVVFAGGVGESGKAGGGYQERVKHAVELYRAGFASHLVFSSGYAFAFREAEVMRDLAVTHGVPAAAITLETRAANTYENVVRSRDILMANRWPRILLVSSPYHMRRASLTWRRVAPEITVVPAPVPQSQFYQSAWGPSLEQVSAILHEYRALAYYRWKGWL